MKKNDINVLGIVLSSIFLIAPGLFTLFAVVRAFIRLSNDRGVMSITILMLFVGIAMVFFGSLIIRNIITNSTKHRAKKFLEKRGKRYDRIYITSYAYDRNPNPMAEQYKKIVEDKIRSYLPEGIRADERDRASLYINCHWHDYLYDSYGSSIDCTIDVYDNLNKSKKNEPLFTYKYSLPHKKSQFVKDNFLLSTMTFVEREDFIEFIKSISEKLKNDGLELLIKKTSGTASKNNMGTYFRDEEHAHDFWAAQYVLNGPPVIICSFDTVEKAREAILTISFISEKEGKLISSETVDYGCYKNSKDKGEIIICGHDFLKDMYDEVKLKLENAGGTITQDTPPEEQSKKPTPQVQKNDVSDNEVTYVKTTKRELAPGVTAIYENYRAPSEAAAKEFLAYKLIM